MSRPFRMTDENLLNELPTTAPWILRKIIIIDVVQNSKYGIIENVYFRVRGFESHFWNQIQIILIWNDW